MPWFKVDDGFSHHGKVLRLPRKDRAACIGMWCLAGSWSAKTLTDGRIEADLLPEFGGTRRLADLLVRVGLWSVEGDGYRFHDWDKYQPTKVAVEAEREEARKRMANARAAKRSPEVRPNTSRTSGEVQECSDNPVPIPAQPSPDPARSSGSVENPTHQGDAPVDNGTPKRRRKAKQVCIRHRDEELTAAGICYICHTAELTGESA